MAYVLSEEQQFLKDSAKDLVKMFPIAGIRTMRDNDDPHGYSTKLWEKMVEMGWPGVAASEEVGGLNFGLRSAGVLMEEAGRGLSASPLLSSLVSAYVLEKYGDEDQKKLAGEICVGSKVVALAIQEGNFYKPSQSATELVEEGDGYRLSGTKDFVADGHVADHFIISAHGKDGLVFVLVAADQAGITIEKEFLMDSRYYARVSFSGVALEPSVILGNPKSQKAISADITSVANALLSAELVGVMTEAFERTVDYLKERRQFDKAIGSFQGLQHRAADLYGEIENCKSISIKALDALDTGDAIAPAYCSMAKAKCVKVAQLATNEGVQMFGGIGMTDDEEIGFFLKRARVAAQQFGGMAYHVDRYAKMHGY